LLALTAFVVAEIALAAPISGWPEEKAFKGWASEVLAAYADPAIKCNKITGIDTTAVGAIRMMGIWCAESGGPGSRGMVAAVEWIGKSINSSFRRKFPNFKGPVAISLWDKKGDQLFGSRDWQ